MVAKERQGKAIVLVCAQCGHPLPIPKADDPNKPHWSWGLLLVGITLLGGSQPSPQASALRCRRHNRQIFSSSR